MSVIETVRAEQDWTKAKGAFVKGVHDKVSALLGKDDDGNLLFDHAPREHLATLYELAAGMEQVIAWNIANKRFQDSMAKIQTEAPGE